jgi:hypothetical protein
MTSLYQGDVNLLTVSMNWINTSPIVTYSYPAYFDSDPLMQAYICISSSYSHDLPRYLDDGRSIIWIGPSDSFVSVVSDSPFCNDISLRDCINKCDLFKKHSNIVSICPKYNGLNGWSIEVGVTAKGFIPCGESSLPKSYGGYKISIINGFIHMMMHPLDRLQHPCPGCSIAPQEFSDFSAACTIGTLGGFVEKNGRIYFVTSGHLFHRSNSNECCGIGTNVSQPGGLAFVLNQMRSHTLSPPMTHYTNMLLTRTREARVPAVLQLIEHPSGTDFNSINVSNIIGQLEYICFGSDPEMDLAICHCSVDIQPLVTQFGVVDKACEVPLAINLSVTEEINWWTEDALIQAVSGRPICCVGYGISTGRIQGFVRSVVSNYKVSFNQFNPHQDDQDTKASHGYVTYSSCIVVNRATIQKGDSGSWVWTPDDKKILGMIVAEHQSKTHGHEVILIPIWIIIRAFDKISPL